MGLFPNGKSDFWLSLWQEARRSAPMRRRRRKTESEMVDGWNRRAGRFAQHTAGDSGRQRQSEVLSFLEQGGALQQGFQVLDVGAGPGTFAIPMARIAGHVTALEPASEMIKILQERAAGEHLDNISVIQRTWQDVNVERDGLARRFDLVFASMTPGVQDPETLKKLIRASRGYCYLSGFSGHRWGNAHCDLWRQFFNEEIGESPNDVIYPFGLLYSLGYRPDFRFFAHRLEQAQPVEEAIEELKIFFENYMDLSPESAKIIEDYVAEHAVDGILHQQIDGCAGMLLWRVDGI